MRLLFLTIYRLDKRKKQLTTNRQILQIFINTYHRLNIMYMYVTLGRPELSSFFLFLSSFYTNRSIESASSPEINKQI